MEYPECGALAIVGLLALVVFDLVVKMLYTVRTDTAGVVECFGKSACIAQSGPAYPRAVCRARLLPVDLQVKQAPWRPRHGQCFVPQFWLSPRHNDLVGQKNCMTHFINLVLCLISRSNRLRPQFDPGHGPAEALVGPNLRTAVGKIRSDVKTGSPCDGRAGSVHNILTWRASHRHHLRLQRPERCHERHQRSAACSGRVTPRHVARRRKN